MSCSHTKVTTTLEFAGFDEDHEEIYEEVSDNVYTTFDIDLHRYKCTQCGEIFYYSSAARSYHEDGVKSNIKGLDK